MYEEYVRKNVIDNIVCGVGIGISNHDQLRTSEDGDKELKEKEHGGI